MSWSSVSATPAVGRDLVPHGDEDERPRARALAGDVGDQRAPRRDVADAKRPLEREPAAGPHPARQRDRRQEAAAARMAVRAELALARHRQEVEPVPERRHRAAGAGAASSRSSVAASAASGVAVIASVRVSLRPRQAARSVAGSVALITRDRVR
jgi:hypothetical protein